MSTVTIDKSAQMNTQISIMHTRRLVELIRRFAPEIVAPFLTALQNAEETYQRDLSGAEDILRNGEIEADKLKTAARLARESAEADLEAVRERERAKLKEAKTEFNKVSENLKANFNKAEKQIKQWRVTLLRIAESASLHLKNQQINEPALALDQLTLPENFNREDPTDHITSNLSMLETRSLDLTKLRSITAKQQRQLTAALIAIALLMFIISYGLAAFIGSAAYLLNVMSLSGLGFCWFKLTIDKGSKIRLEYISLREQIKITELAVERRLQHLTERLENDLGVAKTDLFDHVRKSCEQMVAAAETTCQEKLRKCGTELNQALTQLEERCQTRDQAAQEEVKKCYQEQQARIKENFTNMVRQYEQDCADFITACGYAGYHWQADDWQNWRPPSMPCCSARIGKFILPLAGAQTLFTNAQTEISLPAMLPLADRCGVLFKTNGNDKKKAIECVQSIMLRLLANLPPGKIRFTLIDPVGLGQNVANFLALGDYDEALITNRAWTEAQQIERQLSDLSEHMEVVIQKYLRNDFPTIEHYNEQAGEVMEPYRLLVVNDFPVNFTDHTARKLVSLARNGARCGVYTIVLVDTAQKLPYGFNLEDLEQDAIVITGQDGKFTLLDERFDFCQLVLDSLPPSELFKKIISGIGEMSKAAMKVEVPYTKLLQLAKVAEQSWQQSSSESKMEVPLGPSGARKVQYLTFGEGTSHHALVVGRPGSGKSNLMHVIITTLALLYSPDEIQLYLVDFKKGVEFKPYAEAALPHALAIAIESEREFGLSVLQRLDRELQTRGELFRQAQANSLTEYRQKRMLKMPRVLLIVDEFQEFFTQDDSISRQAALLLDRLVRQGRAFGLHIMLGSQSLAGYTLSRSTLDQMAVRIALQCSGADSRLILADDNAAARLLSRPGEAIYNSASGLMEGNNLFQIALFKDEDRSHYLKMITEQAGNRYPCPPAPIIFEGNEPASLEECAPLKELLASSTWPSSLKVPSLWVGEPVTINPPASLSMRRQSGNNLLVIMRDENEGLGIILAAIMSLCAQHAPVAARFFILNCAAQDNELADFSDQLPALLPHEIKSFTRRELKTIFRSLLDEINSRLETPRANMPEIYLIIHGLHRVRELREDGADSYGYRNEDEPNIREAFEAILREGPEAGVHTIIWSDSYGNAARALTRKLFAEFCARIAGAMSNEDSMHLLDEVAAARLDKPHRALLYNEDRPGYLEKFRPFRIPGRQWLDEISKQLCARH